MTIKDLELDSNSNQLSGLLLPSLLGRVFHVTRTTVFEKILAAGEIQTNAGGELPTVFGSTNSFFRNRGCISFFDYRHATHEQIEDAIGKCSPFHLPPEDHELEYEPKVSYLFLSSAAYGQLIPWTKWKEEGHSGQIVPFVEAGYPASVPLALIKQVLHVTINFPKDSLALRIRRNRFTPGRAPNK